MKDRQNNSQPVAQAVHQKQPVSPAKLTVAPLDNTPLSNWNNVNRVPPAKLYITLLRSKITSPDRTCQLQLCGPLLDDSSVARSVTHVV